MGVDSGIGSTQAQPIMPRVHPRERNLVTAWGKLMPFLFILETVLEDAIIHRSIIECAQFQGHITPAFQMDLVRVEQHDHMRRGS